jgi:hypothetical protein
LFFPAAPNRVSTDPRERWPYFIFFLGVALTAFGSAYFHLRPNDSRLVGDRIPMTIGFTGLVAGVVSERISVQAGLRLLAPLVALGIGSVCYWRMTEAAGHGDLRLYGLLQYGSLLAVVLLKSEVMKSAPRVYRGGKSAMIYGLAKGFEAADRQIFALGGIVSRHTLKHVAAAISAYWILRMLQLRQPILSAGRIDGLTPC